MTKEIQQEVLTDQEKEALLRQYFIEQGQAGFPGIDHSINKFSTSQCTRDACIITCGSCGIRWINCEINKQYTKVFLISLIPYLVYSESQLAEYRKEQSMPCFQVPCDSDGTKSLYIRLRKLKSDGGLDRWSDCCKNPQKRTLI